MFTIVYEGELQSVLDVMGVLHPDDLVDDTKTYLVNHLYMKVHKIETYHYCGKICIKVTLVWEEASAGDLKTIDSIAESKRGAVFHEGKIAGSNEMANLLGY